MFFSEYFFWEDEAEGRRELTNKQHQKVFRGLLDNKKKTPEQNANFRAVSFARAVYPSLSLRIAFHGWSLLT